MTGIALRNPMLLGSVWDPRVPEWEPTAMGWLFVGFLVLGALFCVRQLTRFRPSRMWALARTEFCRSWRHQLWWLVPVWALAVIGLGAYIRAPSPVDRLPQAIEQVLGTQTVLPMLGLLVWTASALPTDQRSGVLALHLTKPTTTLEQITGRVLGVSGMAVVMVACFFVIGLIYLNFQAGELLTDARTRLAEQEAAYAADPSAMNFPNPSLKRVVTEGVLTSLQDVQPLKGDPREEEYPVDGGPPKPPNRHEQEARGRRADRRLNVGAVEAGTSGKIWIRGGTRERAVFHFPELAQARPHPPTAVIRVTPMWIVGTRALPGLSPTQDGKPVPMTDIELEIEFRPKLGKGLKRQRVKLNAGGVAILPLDLRAGLLTDERNRYGPMTVNVICASKMPVALGLDARSVALYGVLRVNPDQTVEAMPPNALLADPYVKLRDVEGSRWIRGAGADDEQGRFLPTGEIAWFDFPALSVEQIGDRQSVPLRITCRAMARRNFRDSVTGEMLPTEARVFVVPHDRDYGPVGHVRESDFTATFAASQVGDHWITIDRDLLTAKDSKGRTVGRPVRVFLQCMTDGHAVGLTDDSVQMVLSKEPFALNLLRAEGIVLIHLVSVIIVGSVWGSLLNRPLAVCGSVLWYVFGLAGPLVVFTIFFDPFFGKLGGQIFSVILQLFPQYGRLNASDLIRDSRSIGWSTVWRHFMAVGGYALCHILWAAAVLDRREVD